MFGGGQKVWNNKVCKESNAFFGFQISGQQQTFKFRSNNGFKRFDSAKSRTVLAIFCQCLICAINFSLLHSCFTIAFLNSDSHAPDIKTWVSSNITRGCKITWSTCPRAAPWTPLLCLPSTPASTLPPCAATIMAWLSMHRRTTIGSRPVLPLFSCSALTVAVLELSTWWYQHVDIAAQTRWLWWTNMLQQHHVYVAQYSVFTTLLLLFWSTCPWQKQ